MILKYTRSTLISRLKNRFLPAAALTLVMLSMITSPASIMPSFAQTSGGTEQKQQPFDGEWPNSGDPVKTEEVRLLPVEPSTNAIIGVIPALVGRSEQFTAFTGTRDITIIGLPAGTKAVNAWVTESAGGVSHIGGALFTTSSVQLSQDGTRVRIRFNSNWPSNLNAIAMIVF
jgi:hypothetical protein